MAPETSRDTTQAFLEDINSSWHDCLHDWMENYQLKSEDLTAATLERQQFMNTFMADGNRQQFWDSQNGLLTRIFNKLAAQDV